MVDSCKFVYLIVGWKWNLRGHAVRLLTYLVYAGMGSFSIEFWLLTWRASIGRLVVVCFVWIRSRELVVLQPIVSFFLCFAFGRLAWKSAAKFWSHVALVGFALFLLFLFFFSQTFSNPFAFCLPVPISNWWSSIPTREFFCFLFAQTFSNSFGFCFFFFSQTFSNIFFPIDCSLAELYFHFLLPIT